MADKRIKRVRARPHCAIQPSNLMLMLAGETSDAHRIPQHLVPSTPSKPTQRCLGTSDRNSEAKIQRRTDPLSVDTGGLKAISDRTKASRVAIGVPIRPKAGRYV